MSALVTYFMIALHIVHMVTSFAHCSYCCLVKFIVENDEDRRIFDKVAYPFDLLNVSETDSRFFSGLFVDGNSSVALLNASNSVPEILSDFSSSSVVDLLLWILSTVAEAPSSRCSIRSEFKSPIDTA